MNSAQAAAIVAVLFPTLALGQPSVFQRDDTQGGVTIVTVTPRYANVTSATLLVQTDPDIRRVYWCVVNYPIRKFFGTTTVLATGHAPVNERENGWIEAGLTDPMGHLEFAVPHLPPATTTTILVSATESDSPTTFATSSLAVTTLSPLRITAGPTISNPTDTSADLSWQTNRAGDTRVSYTSSPPAWQLENSGGAPDGYGFLSAVAAASSGVAVAVGGYPFGRILRFSPAASAWLDLGIIADESFTDVTAQDPETFWAVGGGGVYLSDDAGHTWARLTTNLPSSASWICVAAHESGSPTTVIISGFTLPEGSPLLYRSTDAGEHWTSILPPDVTGGRFFDIALLDANTFWVVGENGHIFHTASGGQAWTDQSIAGRSFQAISALSEGEAVVVATGGEVYWTTDAGDHWLLKTSGHTQINAALLVSSQEAWTFGVNGATLHSVDGGANWVSGTLASQNLTGAAIVSPRRLYVVGWNSTIHSYRSDYAGGVQNVNTAMVTDHAHTMTPLVSNTNYFIQAVSADGVHAAGRELELHTQALTSLRVTAQVRTQRDSDPLMVPLPGATVRLSRGAEVYEPVITDDNGVAAFPCTWDAALGGHYEIQQKGPRFHVKAHWRDELSRPQMNPVVRSALASESGPQTTYVWPSDDSNIDEGASVHAAYFVNRARIGFWEHDDGAPYGSLWQWRLPSRLMVGVGDSVLITIFDYNPGLGRRGGAGATANMLGLEFLQSAETAQDANSVYHELTHNIIADVFRASPGAHARRIGIMVDQNRIPSYEDEGWAMDEALADYFAATFSNDPIIGRCVAWIICGKGLRRDLRKDDRLPTNRPYSMEPHVGSVYLSSALWDLRESVGPTVANHLALSALQQMVSAKPSNARFYFTDYYVALWAVGEQSPFSGMYQQQIYDAFEAHNLTTSPAVQNALGWADDDAFTLVEPGNDDIALAWRSVPTCSQYRVLASSVNYDIGASLGTYFVVADSVADTTYVYPGRDPRTEYLFSVIPVDVSGQPGFMSSPVLVAALDSTVVDAPQREGVTDTRGRWLFTSPNPFASGTSIVFELGAPDVIEVTVFDVAGRQVRRFPQRRVGAGRSRIRWDGRDDSGRPVSSAGYYVSLRGTAWQSRGKIVLLK